MATACSARRRIDKTSHVSHSTMYLFVGVVWLLAKVHPARSTIVDVTAANFNETAGKMMFSILFIASKDCSRCEVLYPKFLAASQPFEGDPEILFGQVHDDTYIKGSSITKFPSIIYYEPGSVEYKEITKDFTVDGMIDTIAEAMRGDFSRVKREYAVEINEQTFKSIVLLPDVHVMIIIYENKAAKRDLETFEKIAHTFRNDDNIIFGKINAADEKNLASDFALQKYPGIYWYTPDEKNIRKRYGGKLDVEELVTFVNDQLQIMRNVGGDLQELAGRIIPLDQLVELRMSEIFQANNLDRVIKEMEDVVQPLKNELANYYLYIVKKIQEAKTSDFLEDERAKILKEFSNDKMTPLQMDSLRRKQNILHKFIDEMAMFLIHGDSSFNAEETQTFSDALKTSHMPHEEL